MPEKDTDQGDKAQTQAWDQFGPSYDWPPFSGQARSYVIASSGRSGSHYLAHLLFEIGQLGSPLEYLHPHHLARWKKILGVHTATDVLRELIGRRTGPHGWFGIKAHWSQFAPFAADSDMVKDLRIERFIRLKRLDTVAQAVSMVIAKQSGAWISYHDPSGVVSFDFDMIERGYRALQKEDTAWANYFTCNGITPHTVFYEHLNTNPERAVTEILVFLELDSPELLIKSGSGPQRQATDRNVRWCRQFRQEAASRGVELK